MSKEQISFDRPKMMQPRVRVIIRSVNEQGKDCGSDCITVYNSDRDTIRNIVVNALRPGKGNRIAS